MNFVLWICAITDAPEIFLNGESTKFKDMHGVERWWRGVFEGDDSFCRLVPGIKEADSFYTEFLERWKRYGHRMKLVICTTQGEFCGTHYEIKNGKLTGRFTPDVGRSLTNWGISCSPGSLEAFKRGDAMKIRETAVACQGSFRGITPQLCRGLAHLGFVWPHLYVQGFSDLTFVPMHQFLEYTVELQRNFNLDVTRGADHHRSEAFN